MRVASQQNDVATRETRMSIAVLGVLLGCLTMLGPFSIDAVLPAFHSMQANLSADALQIQQVITAYLVPYSLMSLLHGPLSDALGRR